MVEQRSGETSKESAHHAIRRKPLATTPSQPRQRTWSSQHVRRLVHGWWAWELIAASVSVAAMIALIGVLAGADQHKQKNWAVGGTELTLNTIVAAIGTIIRSSLLLAVAGALNQSAWNWFAARNRDIEAEGKPLEDLETFSEAAASSWNSLKLLWRTRCRYITSIGALIVILSIAFDTFVQQVLTTNLRPHDEKLTGGNLTAANILPSILSFNDNGNSGGETANTLQLETVITNGVIKTNTTLPGADCPTGECQWPVTPTIGVCSECKHVDATVTSSSNKTCDNTIYTLPPLSGLNASEPGMSNSSLTMSTCSGGNYYANWQLDIEALSSGLTGDGVKIRNTTIAHFYSFGAQIDALNKGSQTDFFAHKCSFWLCVQGYSASSASGSTRQHVISTTADRAHLVQNSTDQYWWKFDDVPSDLNVAPTTVIQVEDETRQLIGDPFVTVLAGSGQAMLGESIASNLPSGDAAYIMWYSSSSLANLTARVQGIADSMTSHIRTNSPAPAPNARYAPTVQVSEVIVGVRWPWLSYPLTLLVAGLVFLGMTMYATRRRQVRPWKGHRMPLLLADLDENVKSQARGGLSHRTGLEDRVGVLKVRLDFDGDDGIAFRQVYSKSKPHSSSSVPTTPFLSQSHRTQQPQSQPQALHTTHSATH